jgi:hypothetical protein
VGARSRLQSKRITAGLAGPSRTKCHHKQNPLTTSVLPRQHVRFFLEVTPACNAENTWNKDWLVGRGQIVKQVDEVVPF